MGMTAGGNAWDRVAELGPEAMNAFPLPDYRQMPQQAVTDDQVAGMADMAEGMANLPAGVLAKLPGLLGIIAGKNAKTADLPMDEASRMVRARDWNPGANIIDNVDEITTGKPVTIKTYRGTSHADDQLDLSLATPENEYGTAVYSTVNPVEASKYAQHTFDRSAWGQAKQHGDSPNVMPLYIKSKNPLVVTERLDLFDADGELTKFGKSIIDEANERVGYGWEYNEDDLYDVLGEIRTPDGQLSKAIAFDDARLYLEESYPDDGSWAESLADRMGHDVLIAGDEVISYSPKNIRSRFAKFDPSKADSSNILAGATGAALLGSMAYPQDD
jgi:hypothetical protein